MTVDIARGGGPPSSPGRCPKAGGSYLELEDILDTVEFLLETAIDTHSQHTQLSYAFLEDQCRTRPSA